MKAKLIAKAKEIYDDGSIVEVVIWELPDPIPPSTHKYKYRFYYGREGSCFVRYDNERGKVDHKHINSIEIDYSFTSIDQFLNDFEKDIANWSKP